MSELNHILSMMYSGIAVLCLPIGYEKAWTMYLISSPVHDYDGKRKEQIRGIRMKNYLVIVSVYGSRVSPRCLWMSLRGNCLSLAYSRGWTWGGGESSEGGGEG